MIVIGIVADAVVGRMRRGCVGLHGMGDLGAPFFFQRDGCGSTMVVVTRRHCAGHKKWGLVDCLSTNPYCAQTLAPIAPCQPILCRVFIFSLCRQVDFFTARAVAIQGRHLLSVNLQDKYLGFTASCPPRPVLADRLAVG